MQIIFFMSSVLLAAENSFLKLENHLKKIDSPKPGIERFEVEYTEIGYFCSYKNNTKQYAKDYNVAARNEFKKYKKCEFLYNGVYFFNKSDFDETLVSIIKEMPVEKYDDYFYVVKSKDLNDAFTLSFICADCNDTKNNIEKSLKNIFRNRCKK
tara:strand:- start:456 stop:917 length:462 start_codon:yes stop_codon:yes gene_type:complete